MQMHAQSDSNNLLQVDTIKNDYHFSSSYLFFHPDWDLENDKTVQSGLHSFHKSGYKASHLPGFFCKMEYKIEQKSKLSPRFRLGSLNYTEWMEGKGEFYTRYHP